MAQEPNKRSISNSKITARFKTLPVFLWAVLGVVAMSWWWNPPLSRRSALWEGGVGSWARLSPTPPPAHATPPASGSGAGASARPPQEGGRADAPGERGRLRPGSSFGAGTSPAAALRRRREPLVVCCSKVWMQLFTVQVLFECCLSLLSFK